MNTGRDVAIDERDTSATAPRTVKSARSEEFLELHHNCQRYLDLLKASLCASLYDESAWELVDGAWPLATGFLRYPVEGTKNWVRSKLFAWLRKRCYAVVQMRPFNPSLRENGQDWPMFGYSMVGHRRLENLQRCIEDVLRRQRPR